MPNSEWSDPQVFMPEEKIRGQHILQLLHIPCLGDTDTMESRAVDLLNLGVFVQVGYGADGLTENYAAPQYLHVGTRRSQNAALGSFARREHITDRHISKAAGMQWHVVVSGNGRRRRRCADSIPCRRQYDGCDRK